MGKVIAKFTLTNYADLLAQQLKVLKGKPRTVEVEALVDTGATRLYLKPSIIKKLGLSKTGTVNSRTTNGNRERGVYSLAKMKLLGRVGNFDVADIEEDQPNLLGRIALHYLDFVVDPKNQCLRGNPEHGDKLMTEEY